MDALTDGPKTTRTLCTTLDASESGVYAATGGLRENGVVEATDDRLRLTGLGHVVADFLERRRSVEALVETDRDYWRTHDVRALPSTFRARLTELADHDVFRVSDTDPAGAVRLIHDNLQAADSVAVVSPVHFPGLGETLRDVCADRPGRLLVTPDVVEEIHRYGGDVVVPERLTIRVADASFALAVANETTFLSLPRLDGSYDPSSELVADGDDAVRFGTDLFEAVWRDATPIDDVTTTRSI
ncbi:Predicted transcriptional regulator, contains HTH domain [Halogeometricum limi]|uniref:Predicted transcriptional regulator, contains HTH domain n=1 Tax=Halogeometricum limi TaxID=555875 RepID=A0A1I6G3I1_9EURY|nr:transcriptional regulator FilR1 domain-containing protein [Halogeometricum limi]SFR36739.1 Predicted transcriptional regulator, contains HTH domain [Halogeometricum limi]